ncbi:MAG TPA: ABC transporter ATP-binding protein, partial [Vicinamibacterales bacterium]|nr:ABC transporter ATP-binding protein [Vicinamibacterales bacterium]
AGKTTTIKVLLGMTHPTSGRALVFGLSTEDAVASVAIRRRAGFVSEDKDLYDAMTVHDIIRFTAGFYPKWRSDLETRYLRSFELPLARKVKQLSHGTRTKLALLLALCRGADLLVLDEPMSGLDPAISEEVLQALVRHVADEHATVFLSSHQLADIDQIADHVAIIERGRAVVCGSLEDIRDGHRRIQIVFEGDAPALSFRTPGVIRTRRDGRVLTVFASGAADAISAEAQTFNPVSVDVTALTLKEIFLESVNASVNAEN